MSQCLLKGYAHALLPQHEAEFLRERCRRLRVLLCVELPGGFVFLNGFGGINVQTVRHPRERRRGAPFSPVTRAVFGVYALVWRTRVRTRKEPILTDSEDERSPDR